MTDAGFWETLVPDTSNVLVFEAAVKRVNGDIDDIAPEDEAFFIDLLIEYYKSGKEKITSIFRCWFHLLAHRCACVRCGLHVRHFSVAARGPMMALCALRGEMRPVAGCAGRGWQARLGGVSRIVLHWLAGCPSQQLFHFGDKEPQPPILPTPRPPPFLPSCGPCPLPCAPAQGRELFPRWC